MSAREDILNRIRVALSDLPDRTRNAPLDWEYGQPTPMDDVLARFVDRCVDYKARVEKVPMGNVPGVIAQVLSELQVTSAVVPSGLDPSWKLAVERAGIEVSEDEPQLTAKELNEIGATITSCEVGIAETGTIVLNHGPDQGRRALTLVPDIHVCVVASNHVVSDVPEAVARLRPSIEAGRPLTWVSGPSATSDIELSRVEGVHGPRTLIVILAAVD